MHELQVRMTVPVLGHPMVRRPEIELTGWLPFDDRDAIETISQGFAVRVWFDITSTWTGPFRHDMNELLKWSDNLKDVRVTSMFVDVGGGGVRDDLVRYIQQRSQSRTPLTDDQQNLQREYESLGRDVYVAAVSTVNRLIAYVRARKGQYWLYEYPSSVDKAAPYFSQFKAAAKVNGGDWFPWRFFTDWTGTGLPLVPC